MLGGSLRYVMIVPVLGCLLAATATTIATVLSAARGLHHAMLSLVMGSLDPREAPRLSLQVIEGSVLTTMLLVFGFGLYQLFIGTLRPAAAAAPLPRLLIIQSVDDLAARLGDFVLVALALEFFVRSSGSASGTVTKSLYMAFGILFVSAALYVRPRRRAAGGDRPEGGPSPDALR